MAAIDKLYGTREQRAELKRFVRRLRLAGHLKRSIYRCFYSVGLSADRHALTHLEGWMDRLLWKQPNLPVWVREAIEFQYNGTPVKTNDGARAVE